MASTSEKDNFPLLKMINKILNRLIKPQDVEDTRMTIFTVSMGVAVLILSTIFFANVFLYRNLFLEVNDLFFANGAVSDIMQCT